MLLENISYPSDLRKYNVDDLKLIADELRQYILESVSKQAAIYHLIWELLN